jgi:hypothetical protein
MPFPKLLRPIPTSVSERNALAQSDYAASRTSGGFSPADHGFIGWTMDPILGSSTAGGTSGTVYSALVKLTTDGPITNVVIPLNGGGTTITLSKVAVFDTYGRLLGVSVDQGTAWQTAGTKTVALTTPTVSLRAGTLVQVAHITVGATGPSIRAGAAAATLSQSISPPRMATLAAQSDMPASLSGQTGTSQTHLIFLS